MPIGVQLCCPHCLQAISIGGTVSMDESPQQPTVAEG